MTLPPDVPEEDAVKPLLDCLFGLDTSASLSASLPELALDFF